MLYEIFYCMDFASYSADKFQLSICTQDSVKAALVTLSDLSDKLICCFLYQICLAGCSLLY